MPLKTGMLVGVVGTDEIGVLIQIREASQTCVIKLNNGTLKKNVPLADVEEARDMTDTKEKKSPIRLIADAALPASGSLSPLKKPGGLSVDVGKSPKKAQSLRLAVGDPVRARYKKGAKWFPGKIIRIRTDGTFDVEYDDGDVEVKVEAACIEVVATKDVRDDEPTTRNKTSPKSSSSEFEVGMKVKAQYQKGKNWFSGKIMKVHHDNSCDIRYDDGDSETRVLPKHIEVVKETSRDPPPKAKSSSPVRLEIGAAVQARYKKGAKWFSGKIARVRTDGTFDVEYDDGDVEIKVEASFIEAVVKTKDERPNSREETSSKASTDEFAVGMKVKARYQKGANWFSGKIMKVHHDGSCDIRYDDGDTETRVLAKYIEMPKDSKESPSKTKASPSRLEVGDAVQARYKKGTKWFPGKIKSVHSDGTYDVRYDDGDIETRVVAAHIEPTRTNRDDHLTSSAKKSPHRQVDDFSVGNAVNARYKRGKKVFPGKIIKVRTDGTYDVRYDDGDVEMHVEASLIERSIDSARSNDSEPLKKTHAKELSVGDRINANYKKEPKHKGIRKLFSGKITRVRTDGTFDVRYDDGDVEMHVERSFIEVSDDEKSKLSPSKRVSLEVGDSVKARYKRGTKWFSGKITRAHSDGTYDIKYEDGDVETRVDKSYIEVEPKKSEKEIVTSKKVFQVGDKVNARYKNGQKWFPGKIAKARTDGTFDILYDDGDEELRMPADRLEALEPVKSTKPQAKSTTNEDDDIFGSSDSSSKAKTSKKLSVGDKVKANYKRKGAFQRGKIVRVHKDGKFDIEYDSGSVESRVASKDIQSTKRPPGSDSEAESRHKGSHRNHRHNSSDSDAQKPKEKKPTKSHRKKHEPSSSSAESEKPLKKGMRVALKNGKDAKSKRVAVIKRVHSDGTCDLKYAEGDETLRVPSKRLHVCSDSEDSDAGSKRRHGSAFMRNQKVLASWRRPSKLSKPRLMTSWQPATVVEIHADGTYTIRYESGDVEEDAPPESIKLVSTGSESNSSDDSTSRTRHKKARQKQNRGSDRVKNETLYLLEQLAMTLFEEGAMKKKPKLVMTSEEEESSSESNSSSDGSSATNRCSSKMDIDAILLRLFGKSLLTSFRERFNEKDTKEEGRISKSKIIPIIEDLCRDKSVSKPNNARAEVGDDPSVKQILAEWFDTHDDIRTDRKFGFDTFMLAFAYAKHRLGKVRIEQSITGTLEARFASHHEHQRQLELWQQKLGVRMFEILQRNFQDSALPAMIPSRVRVSELARIFDHVTKNAAPNKPLAVHLQQLHLREHQTLLLSEFLCCYYQLYGSANHHGAARVDTLELRPIAFIASCFFSSGDPVCNRHGDLVRRLCVGRTSGQQDMVARFREVFEELMASDSENTDGAISSSQLNAFAAKVVSDSVVLEPALVLLRKRCATVSLIEIFATCGFVIDDLIAAPTVANAIAKLRMRVDVADVRRIIGLVRSICLKILRFPNNSDYWRIRMDSEAFQLKIGRFDGATSVLEAVGFVEYKKTHFELRGARMMDGSRVSSLARATLEALREKCVQLEGELSMFDGVESITTILERIVSERQRQNIMTAEEVDHVLKCLSLYVDNILKNPKDSRCWRIREGNKAFQRQIGYLPFATDLMVAIGFDNIATSQGTVFVLRGTGVMDSSVTKADTSNSASLANFAFSRVSEQMEWFLWRRKQEIDHLQSDEFLLLEIVSSTSTNQPRTAHSRLSTGLTGQTDLAMGAMYPYAKNAVHVFNSTAVQRSQIEMMKTVFDRLDTDKVKSLEYEAYCQSSLGGNKQMLIGLEPLPVEGKMGFEDFVASLGPLLDHPFDAETTELLSFDNMALCEQVSSLVGRLRIQTSAVEAGVVLAAFIEFLCRIIQEPDKPERWYLDESSSMGQKILCVAAIRQLMRLAGFVDANDSASSSGKFVLRPRQLKFKTTKASEQPEGEHDVGTITRLKTIACMAAGHWRGLKHPEISDVGAVSRAVGLMRNMAQWTKLVELVLVCIENILKHPDHERFRQLNTSTATYASIVSSTQGGADLLLSVGFRETDTGKLILPFDVSLAVLRARKLELEVGLNVMRSVRSLSLHQNAQVADRQLVHPSFADHNFGEGEVEYYKKKAHAAEVARQEQVKKNVQLARQLERASKTPVVHTSRFSTLRPKHISSTKLTKTILVRTSSDLHVSRQVSDQIEQEILSPLSPRKSISTEGTVPRSRPSTGTKASQARGAKPLTSGSVKISSWRPSTTPSTPSGHPLVLAMNVEAGANEIYVAESSLVRRGMLLRIGSELPDLVEERVIIDVTAANGAIQGLSRISLASSLCFYHPAKEFIFLIPQEAARASENMREGDLALSYPNNGSSSSLSTVIELMIKRNSVMERFHESLEAMEANVSYIRQCPLVAYPPEHIYALTMSSIRWQRQLTSLEECQLSITTSDEIQPASLYKPSVTAAQQLKQLLWIPLPQTAPIGISAVIISSDSSQIRILGRMVFEATGKMSQDARSALPLTVICATNGDDTPELQQELVILQKLQHWRARELFLPVCWSALEAPILPSQQVSHTNVVKFNEGHVIVTHSLYGWVSLKDCVHCMRIPGLSLLDWRTMLSYWSCQVILIAIALESESFQLSSIAFESLLVSHDGSELRMASLAAGRHNREQSTEGTLVVGEFILQLLSYFTPEASEHGTTASFVSVSGESDRMIARRRRVLEVLGSASVCDPLDCALSLTELSRPCDILTFQTSQVVPEVVALAKAMLLAFQKPSGRPTLEALWSLLLGAETHSEPSQTEASNMMSLVRLRTIYEDKVLSVLSRYEHTRKRRHVDSVQLGLLSWMDLLQQMFAMINQPGKTKARAAESSQRIFMFIMKRLVSDRIVARFAAIVIDDFASSSSRNEAEEAVQVVLKAIRCVFELVNEAFECIQHINVEAMELVVSLLEQAVRVLCCIASGHQNRLPKRSTDCSSCSRYPVSTCAVLWRLCESTVCELLSLETTQSPYPMLLAFLKACKPSKWEGSGSAKNGDYALWWNSSQNALPQRLSQQEQLDHSQSNGVLSFEHLSVVHQTLEVAFKITSGVAVPKFRLAALQEWFSSAFLERKACAPLIFVLEPVALVWKSLNFSDFLRQSLRDHDLSMVFGALSLMECATRVLRFHPIKTPVAARSSNTNANQSLLKHRFASRATEFALSLCSHRMILELMELLSTTTRALKVLGESRSTSVAARSRNSAPLLSILNVLCSLLVNMLHAGEAATQHWASTGLLHFILTHAKGNALSFVKVHDSNMVNDLYHHRNRWIQQREPSHWTVFEFSHGSTAVSPFRCLLGEIMTRAGSNSVFLLQALMLSPYFVQEATSSAAGKRLVQQTDLFCHPGYGSVSHAYDLAIDLRGCNGTLDEVVQLITYAKALFLMLKASAQSCVSAFPRLAVELWRWMEATWTNLIAGTKAITQHQMQKQSEVVVAGFALLHAITTHHSLTVDELMETTTFVSTLPVRKSDRVSAFDVLLTGFCASLDRLDSADDHGTDANQVQLLRTVAHCALHVLVSTLDTPSAAIATAIVDQCVDVELIVELLDRAPSPNVLPLHQKQQLWRSLLHIHSRRLTMRLLECEFMERVMFSRLASDATTDRRLEGVMFLEVLVTVCCLHWGSSKTQLLFSEACKLLLHHRLVPREAERLRSQAQASNPKAVRVTKRLMQLVCCLCVDFVAQSPDAVFVERLAAAGVPLEVIAYHQRSEPKSMSEMDVTLFWSDWDGAHSNLSNAAASPATDVVAVPSTNIQKRSQVRRALVHFAIPNTETSEQPLMSDPQKPMRSLPRKNVDLKSRVARPIEMPPTRAEPAPLSISPVKAHVNPERTSLVHAILRIDMESAQAIDQRIKTRPKEDVSTAAATAANGSGRNAQRKRPELTVGDDDESMDLDAYSPFNSSSEAKTPPRRNESDQKSRTGQRPREETKQHKRSSSSSSEEDDAPTPARRAARLPKPEPDVVAQPPPAQSDARLRRVFAKYDVDGDGEISFVDLRTALKGQRLSNVEIQKWITDKDRRGCGRVCFADFARAFASDAS